MSDVIDFNFENQPITVVTEDGEVWFVASELSKALGYSQTGAMNKIIDEEDKKKRVIQNGLNYVNQSLINESGVYQAIFGSTKTTAKRFKKWVTSEVLPSIRKTGSYTAPSQHKQTTPAELLEGAEVLARILNLNGSSLVGAMKRTVKANYPALLPMIPDYAIDAPVVAGQEGAQSSEVCFSLTELLKRSGVKISAIKANKRLLELGILEEKERPSSKGVTKKFKCITKSGLNYGKNVVSEQNPRETQPQWFESKFDELLTLLS